MIFVIVGMHYQSFNRLIKKMDEISGKINEEVIMQIGHAEYKPKNATFFNFVKTDQEILDLIKQARIVVSHAGAGTILNILKYNKPAIVVPRLKKFNEHIDDQQIEIAEELSKMKKIISVYDVEKIENLINNIENIDLVKQKQDNKLITYLKSYIKNI
jgi:UDP-N-acetylglucosamine transferase subunit ALG13